MRSYADLVEDVRAQVHVTPETAKAWLLDRARVMNAEAQWNQTAIGIEATGERYIPMPPNYVTSDAVLVGGVPYERSSQHKLDQIFDQSGYWPGRIGVYSEGVSPETTMPTMQLYPVPGPPTMIEIRYVFDLSDTDLTTPFPSDIDSCVVDGAIAMGLARMDERFDSAQYFETRFTDGIARLRRRRHGKMGSGYHQIRVVG
jgi:hypothetical protein